MKTYFTCLVGTMMTLVFCSAAQSGVVYMVGTADDLAAPSDPASPSSALVAGYAARHGQGVKDFDVFQSNLGAAHTFADLPGNIVAATLIVRVKANTDGFASNDFINVLQFDGTASWDDSIVWGNAFAPMKEQLGIGQNSWSPREEAVFVLDLAALPKPQGVRVDILPQLNTHGFLDVVIADDTAVDFLQLRIETNPIPEPASLLVWSLLGMACCGLGRLRKPGTVGWKIQQLG